MPTIATAFPIKSFAAGGGLPTVYSTGTVVTAPEETAIRAAAALQNVTIINWVGPPGEVPSQNPIDESAAITLIADMIEAALVDERVANDAKFKTRAADPTLDHRWNNPRIQPVTTDITSITTGFAADSTYTTGQYFVVTGSTIPAGWPIQSLGGESFAGSGFMAQLTPLAYGARLHRVWTDADDFVIYTYAGANSRKCQFYVDGRPASAAPTTLGAGSTFTRLLFPDARPRLIEFYTAASLGACYVKPPYRMRKPEEVRKPRFYVMGDSYTVQIADATTPDGLDAPYNRFHQLIDVPDLWIDGQGGSGYIRDPDGGGTLANYQTRLAYAISKSPDVLWVHGGGANDLFGGSSVADIVTAVTNFFMDAREGLPNAKLVFCEGFAPPVYFNTFNDEYITIRTQVQTNLADVGVYYVDVATTSPWIFGAGYVGATVADGGNSNTYIGSDGAHPTILGARYIGRRMAAVARRILNDDGTLLNQLVRA